MRTAIRAIALTAAVGTAAIAAPVMSIGGSTPVDQASARPATPRPYDPQTDPDNRLICPPGTVPLANSCGMLPDDSREHATDWVVIFLGGAWAVGTAVTGIITG